MNSKLFKIFILIFFISFNALAQESKVTNVSYANISIAVPDNYKATSEYEIKNDTFSAQWIYLTKEMVAQNIQYQILEKISSQVPVEEIGPIEFTSSGGKFSGKKYQFKNSDGPLKYVVFAYGIVGNQPLILNLHFKNEPINNKDFDELTKIFIRFSE